MRARQHVYVRKPREGREAAERRIALFNLGIGELSPLPNWAKVRRAARFAQVGNRPTCFKQADTHLYYAWNKAGDRDDD
jgi:hypothetical protein